MFFLFLLFSFFVTFSQNSFDVNFRNALVSSKKGENLAAIAFYEKAYLWAMENKQFINAGRVCVEIASENFSIGDYKSAIENCRKGLDLFHKKRLANDTILFKLHSSIAPCLKNTYQIVEAQKHYFLANQLVENSAIESSIPEYVAYHYYNQGIFWLKLHDITQAKYYFEKK